MKIVLSPAKALDYTTPALDVPASLPAFPEQTHALVDILRGYDEVALSGLMSISAALSRENVARYQRFSETFDETNSRPALYAFNGDVYDGLSARTLTRAEAERANKLVRILSGLYGVLRPFDLMQPYRLEMGTKLPNPTGKDLYAFWGERISGWLNEALAAQGDDVLLNLASNEYFGAVKRKALNARIIDTEFKDLKNGQYKIISFYAKKARGLMARYVIKERLTNPEGLKDFNYQGYRYSAEHSKADSLVFLRDQPQD